MKYRKDLEEEGKKRLKKKQYQKQSLPLYFLSSITPVSGAAAVSS
jgi:hypothetical protein